MAMTVLHNEIAYSKILTNFIILYFINVFELIYIKSPDYMI